MVNAGRCSPTLSAHSRLSPSRTARDSSAKAVARDTSTGHAATMARRTRQLSLDLHDVPRWGGRRAGAGRKQRAAFAAACERGRFRLAHYSIQHDHVHLIVEAAGKHALACGMKSIAARVARATNRIFRRRGPVLADRYHHHTLRTPREVRNALAYVLLNARRHLAKRGPAPALGGSADPASSGRWFAGWSRGSNPRLPHTRRQLRRHAPGCFASVGADPLEVPGSRS
jgi:REP-associated tyrosine transposase